MTSIRARWRNPVIVELEGDARIGNLLHRGVSWRSKSTVLVVRSFFSVMNTRRGLVDALHHRSTSGRGDDGGHLVGHGLGLGDGGAGHHFDADLGEIAVLVGNISLGIAANSTTVSTSAQRNADHPHAMVAHPRMQPCPAQRPRRQHTRPQRLRAASSSDHSSTLR
jgi:hypothetical protein